MREVQPRVEGRQAAERGSYWGWTLAAVLLHVVVLLWARWVKPALPGAIDESSPTGSEAHAAFADAYAETARGLRVKSARLGAVLSLLLHGGVGFAGLYDEVRTRMALAAERRVASVVEEAFGEPESSAEVSARTRLGAVAGRRRVGGDLPGAPFILAAQAAADHVRRADRDPVGGRRMRWSA